MGFVLLNQFIYTVSEVVLLTRHVSKLILTIPSSSHAMTYQAGQYIKIIHDNGNESPLSIASAPNHLQQLELHLSHGPRNQQAQTILEMIKADGVLSLTGPYGVCTVSRFSLDRPIVFFVRGTGFAPVKAILEELVQMQDCPPLHLYWGVASAEDFYFPELITHWEQQFADFRFTSMVSRSADLHQLHHAVLQDYPSMSHVEVYASGGEEMVFSALEIFQEHGLEKTRFYSDMV
jgi:CDP-4-dehydro-6-deoxyglucose reductase